jgi:hypothetical protein
MSNLTNLPPLPWEWEDYAAPGTPPFGGAVYMRDANQRRIALLWGSADERAAMAHFLMNVSVIMHEARAVVEAMGLPDGLGFNEAREKLLQLLPPLPTKE